MTKLRHSYIIPVAGLGLILIGVILIGLSTLPDGAATALPLVGPAPTSTPVPTRTPEPLIPTRTSTPTPAPTKAPASPTSTREPSITSTAEVAMPLPPTPIPETPTDVPTALPTENTPAATATVAPTLTPTALPSADFNVPPGERFRLGVSIPYGASSSQIVDVLAALEVGWVMDWAVRAAPLLPPGVEYAQSVRFRSGVLSPEAATLTAVAAARPGSLWLISNEPDVRWQDNVTPEVYARLYHEAYTAIKAGDPGAVVVAGGIAQPSDLRHRYLERALTAYHANYGASLPAQAWHIHNYMLREERDTWGVDIPPGLPDDTGVLYGVDDSGNLAAFRAQIYEFRRWMAAHGYAGQPLIVSEFGVPMPPDYGFSEARMAEFLRETWYFFLTATDPALGDPTDGGRLVQRWCWFSLGFPDYPTGNLIDLETGTWTPFGETWLSYVRD